MMHSVAHKHLWPRCLQSSPGISWGWVREEKIILLPSGPPLSSVLHSSSYAFLCCCSFHCPATISSALVFCSNLYLNAQIHSSPGQRGDRRCYFLLLTVPSPLALLILSLFYSLATLTHNNKIPSAAISHQLHAWGAVQQRWPRNKDTQSVVVGATVCQSHLHSMVFQPACLKWGSEGELQSRSAVDSVVGWGCKKDCVLVVNTDKATQNESCALTQDHKAWKYRRKMSR